jgi:hypothetical protein
VHLFLETDLVLECFGVLELHLATQSVMSWDQTHLPDTKWQLTSQTGDGVCSKLYGRFSPAT